MGNAFAASAKYLEQGADLDVDVFEEWFQVQNNGAWLRKKDTKGQTPLHLALYYTNPAPVVLALIEADPDAAKEKDDRGDTPLHVAITVNSPEVVLFSLVAAWSGAIREKNAKGATPLLAALNNVDIPQAVVFALVAACPLAARDKDEHGNTPLYNVLRMNDSPAAVAPTVGVVEALLDVYPAAAKETDKLGNTPLHIALISDFPITIVKALAVLWPGAAKQKGIHGNTPLHICLQSQEGKFSTAMMDAIISLWPGAASERDANGNTPLHLALQHDTIHEEAVLALLAASPSAVKVKCEQGRTPLSIALQKCAPDAVTLALIDACPEATKEKHVGGGTLLHLAFLKERSGPERWSEPMTLASPAVIASIGAAWPGAIKTKTPVRRTGTDQQSETTGGETPLVIALEQGGTLESVLLTMISLCPDAAHEKCPHSSTPLQIALQRKLTQPVLDALISAWPGSVKERNTHGATALYLSLLHSAPQAVTLALVDIWPAAAKETINAQAGVRQESALLTALQHKDASEAVVAALVAAWPEALQTKDQRGRIPLHVALKNNVNEAVLDVLITAWPESILENDVVDGRSALHILLLEHNGAPDQRALAAIVAACPQSVVAKDKENNTPLDYAAQMGSLNHIILGLLSRLQMKNFSSQSSILPFDSAKARQLKEALEVSGILSLLQDRCVTPAVAKPPSRYRCIDPRGIAIRASPSEASAQSTGPAFNDTVNVTAVVLGDTASRIRYLRLEGSNGYLPLELPSPSEEPDVYCFELVQAGTAVSNDAAVDTFTAAAAARFAQMLAAQLPHSDTAPLSERVCSIKEALNICLQTELFVSPTSLEGTEFDECLYMGMHVDPAISVVAEELDTLKAQVNANQEKYCTLLSDLSHADRIVYDESFDKTINPEHGGDAAAYSTMLAKCAALATGCEPLEMHRQPTSELIPLVLMVRANIPAFEQVVEGVVAHAAAAAAAGSSSKSTTPATITFRRGTKSPYRVIEKALTKGPNPDYPDVSTVFDVFGCLIECGDYTQMAAVIQSFADKHTACEFDVSRVKDRWTTPSSSGWRDLMLNVVINGVIFEVQIVLRAMLVARTAPDAHKAYDQYRSFAEVFGLLDLAALAEQQPASGRLNESAGESEDSGSTGGAGCASDAGIVQIEPGVLDEQQCVPQLHTIGLKERLEESEKARAAAEAALAAATIKIAALEAENAHLRDTATGNNQ